MIESSSMKRLTFLLYALVAIFVAGHAQVIPKGMSYQAVARNLKGEILPNQTISLKIHLFSNEDLWRTNYYSERHEVTTNAQGLFNVIIGEGNKEQGEFGLVPWSSQNIWLEVAVKDKESAEFASVSNNKLLAVPYALHAGTADRLLPKQNGQSSSITPPEPGVVSTEWSVFGNAMTDASGNPYHINALGTTDPVDLILITNNVERLRMLATGDILTKLNFIVGKNIKVGQNLTTGLSTTIGDSLTVRRNVLLNTLDGSTINYGPFSVLNQSPALFTGKLTVDQATDLKSTLNVDGATDVNARFFVNNMSPTLLTGTLQVDSITNLNNALRVNNMSPALLSGTLRVDKDAIFNEKVKITSTHSTDTSGIAPSGSLQVGGGAYIGGNLYIGGVAKFGGPVAFAGAVTIQDMTQSNDPSSGALKVSGGTGIGLNLNVGGASMIGGMTTIKDLTESLDTSSGALKVWGGVSIRKRLNVGGAVSFLNNLQVAGITTINNSLSVMNTGSFIAHFTNTTNQHGIRIQINNPAPGDANHFVEFRNSSGGVVGRIEGENANEYKLNAKYILDKNNLETSIYLAEVTVASNAIRLASAIAGVVAAAASTTVCAGLGVCVSAPIISMIVQAALDVAARTIALASSIVGLDDAKARLSTFISYKDARIGVTYESGSGDYAEWLPKENPEEQFLPGQIVGLKHGKISKVLEGADKFMVISTKPIVLGNAPAQDQKNRFEKVAFMGQVPVHVLGKARAGDYILPSGAQDGMGRAVSPADMKAEDFANIIGTAWSDSENDTYSLVNVAVGLYDGDIHKVIAGNQENMEDLKDKFNKSNEALSRLLPEYSGYGNSGKAGALDPALLVPGIASQLTQLNMNGFNIYEISGDQIMDMLNMAEKTIVENGGNLDSNPFWSRLKSDPSYKIQMIKDIQKVYKKEIQHQIESLKPRQ